MALQSVSTVQNITFSKMIYISFLRSSAPGTRNQFQWKNVVKTVAPNGEEIDLSNEILATSKIINGNLHKLLFLDYWNFRIIYKN